MLRCHMYLLRGPKEQRENKAQKRFKEIIANNYPELFRDTDP